MAMRREEKRELFKMEPFLWKQLTYNMFLLDIHKKKSRKNAFQFSKQNKCKLKAVKLFKVLISILIEV